MRILFVHSGADLYGASRSLLRLASRLVRDGHAVTAVLPYQGPLVASLESAGVVVEVHAELPILTRKVIRSLTGIISLPIKFLRSVIHLVKLIREFACDVVHTNTAVVLSSGVAARLAGIPHIWHIRESFHEFGSLWRPYEWFICALSTKIICVSQAVAAQFSRKRLSKVQVIYNGFPKEEFQDVSPERIERFRERYALNSHRLVGVVGRIKFHRKGQEVLARAIALLDGKFPDVKFLFIGSPFPGNEDHLDRLMKLVKELGIENRVVYTGDVEDIGAAYAALDVSVLTSCQPEPFGGVVIESMAYGKPVIGTRIGGTVEQIYDGVTGILVQPGDPKELKMVLDRLLSNPSEVKTMGQRARERFLKHFEFGQFYEEVLRLYDSITQDNSRRGEQ